MNRFFLMAAALLFSGAAVFAQDIVLENGTTQTVNGAWTADMVYVGSNTADNALMVVSGGALVSSNAVVGLYEGASNNTVSVTDSGRWDIENTLQIGNTGTNGTTGVSNSVSVSHGGVISVGDLAIESGNTFELNAGGTLAVATNFDYTAQTASGFSWNEMAHLSVGGELTSMPLTNGMAYLDGERDLTLNGGAWDLTGMDLAVGFGDAYTELTVTNGGSLLSRNAFIGWDTNSTDNTVTVGSGGSWDNSSDLWVGYGGDDNTLELLQDGMVSVGGSLYIGNTNLSDNLVTIDGSNGVLTVAGDLMIGFGTNAQDNALVIHADGVVAVDGTLVLNSMNRLTMATNGMLTVGGMTVQSNTTINGSGTIQFDDQDSVLNMTGISAISEGILFDGGAGSNQLNISSRTFQVESDPQLFSNFQTLNLSESDLAGYGVLDEFDTISMSGGVIDPYGSNSPAGRIEIQGDFSANGTMYEAGVYGDEWDELIITGAAVDSSGMGLDVLVTKTPTTNRVTVLRSSGGLSGGFASTSLVERLLLYTADLDIQGDRVDVILMADTDSGLGSTLSYAATESIRAGFSGMKNSVFTRTKQLRRNLVATVHAIPQEAYLLANTNAPAGAMGPGDQNTIFDMHVWMQHYNGEGDYDSLGVSDSFEMDNNGTTIGFDRLVGEDLTWGLNYTYSRSTSRTAGNDHLDAETYWVGAYGEWVSRNGLYANALAAYGRSTFDSRRVEENYVGEATYRGNAVGAYADVGQYFNAGNFALSPYLGLHMLSIVNEGHDETEQAGSKVYVDEVTRDLVESALGMKMRYRFDTALGRIQTTGFAEWTHDFIHDDVQSVLTGKGLPPVGLAGVSPDEDTINAGLGLSAICTDYLEVGIGYNGRFSDTYEEHTASIMLDVMF